MTTFNPDDIPSRFDFAQSQPRIFSMWQDGGYFHAEPDPSREPYTIVIPPPNVTGALHLGHALNNTLQDTLIRMKRMQGFNTLWMPGTDHAGIATQAVVERRLKEDENKTRHDLGREKLVERIWEWKEQYEARILGQLKQLGSSCDWDRTRFTFDDVCAKAVRHTFFDLFNKTLIYRGKRLVNWDTFLQTTVSDDEVFSKKIKGQFWHFMYPVINPKPGEPAHVTVATTRPETMLGDTAVAVHPEPDKALDRVASELREKLKKASEAEKESVQSQIDALAERRARMLPQLELLRDMANDGRKLMLPLMDREIPLVCDQWAKPELGAGCVKITPAHDPNDYDVAQRCDLPMINLMNRDGTLNVEAGKYEGLTMKQGRKKVVEDLEALGLLEKVEDREIELPQSDRSKTPIEPFLADQWFVSMEQLSQSAIDAVESGKVSITPERYERGYLDWLGEKRDWPVSRQLWWGHQIPVWSIECSSESDVEPMIAQIKALSAYDANVASLQSEPCPESNEDKRLKLGLAFATIHVCVQSGCEELESQLTELGFVRDEDVLDTWFSSALWPHSTLGWPDKTAELEYFYPTSTLITSRDIISLWVARMVLMGLNNLGEIPFDKVYIHPNIQDGFGEKMSKSKGNGIDPLDVIAKFGADALRFGMAHLCTETQDVRLPVQFECPHCEHTFEQTKKNRILPRVACPKCKQEFSTQWAESDEDKALTRGLVISERFETARNFVNKLWNASRFAMINLKGYTPAAIVESDLTVEDRWMLSRLSTVSENVTAYLDAFKYADAMRELYDFAWHHFCSFYVEMLKDRFADESLRPHAQRMLAYSLDCLLKLLHPVMPFVTEDIWQNLAKLCPERGFDSVEPAAKCLITAAWPELDQSWQDPAIENQFALYQSSLGELREIRNSQNIGNKKKVNFSIKCDAKIAASLEPLGSYFSSMANADLIGMGPDIVPPETSATRTRANMEIYVDLEGLIDVAAEIKRLEKEQGSLEKSIQSKERQLGNEKFVAAKPELADEIRLSLKQVQEQLATIIESLEKLRSKV
ncbi:MAG: valyl-tRNA synthetase [Mariniblastus sp.]|jgi:valyl-tRNA synthetase